MPTCRPSPENITAGGTAQEGFGRRGVFEPAPTDGGWMDLPSGGRGGMLRGTAGGLVEGLQGLGGGHARGPQQVDGGGPDLADHHAGLEVAAPLEHGGRLFWPPQREPGGVPRGGRGPL